MTLDESRHARPADAPAGIRPPCGHSGTTRVATGTAPTDCADIPMNRRVGARVLASEEGDLGNAAIGIGRRAGPGDRPLDAEWAARHALLG